MGTEIIPQSYLILTSTVPYDPYKLDDRHTIRAVKTEKWMFEGFSIGIPHGYLAIMALPYIDEQSYDIWRELVMFHAFVCDDAETYDYSERAFSKTHEDSELRFVTNTAYFFERIRITLGRRVLEEKKQLRVKALDFDRLLLSVYPTTQEISNKPLTPEEETILTSRGTVFSEVEPEFSAKVQYRKAFQVYVGLKSKDKRLYDQMRLYVFAKSIREFREVYRNWNCSVALNISILEALAGEPTKCSAVTTCPKCSRPLPPHHVVSVEQRLIDVYGPWFKKLRKIRQRFFHKSDYFDISDVLYEIEHTRDDDQERKISEFEDEVELLEKITRKSLIEAFLEHYNTQLEE